MLVLITYDVNTQDAAGRRRLNKIAKLCVSMDSVFRIQFLNVYWKTMTINCCSMNC